MPEMQTPQMDHAGTEGSALDDLRLHVEKMALRAGIRPEDKQTGQEQGNRRDAETLRGI